MVEEGEPEDTSVSNGATLLEFVDHVGSFNKKKHQLVQALEDAKNIYNDVDEDLKEHIAELISRREVELDEFTRQAEACEKALNNITVSMNGKTFDALTALKMLHSMVQFLTILRATAIHHPISDWGFPHIAAAGESFATSLRGYTYEVERGIRHLSAIMMGVSIPEKHLSSLFFIKLAGQKPPSVEMVWDGESWCYPDDVDLNDEAKAYARSMAEVAMSTSMSAGTRVKLVGFDHGEGWVFDVEFGD